MTFEYRSKYSDLAKFLITSSGSFSNRPSRYLRSFRITSLFPSGIDSTNRSMSLPPSRIITLSLMSGIPSSGVQRFPVWHPASRVFHPPILQTRAFRGISSSMLLRSSKMLPSRRYRHISSDIQIGGGLIHPGLGRREKTVDVYLLIPSESCSARLSPVHPCRDREVPPRRKPFFGTSPPGHLSP